MTIRSVVGRKTVGHFAHMLKVDPLAIIYHVMLSEQYGLAAAVLDHSTLCVTEPIIKIVIGLSRIITMVLV